MALRVDAVRWTRGVLLAALALGATAARAQFADPCITCDTLYAGDCGNTLWAIDTTTGASTRVGTLPTLMFDLAVTSDGRLIGVTSGGQLFTISACDATGGPLASPFIGNGLTGDAATTDLFAQGPPLVRLDSTGSGSSTTLGGTIGPAPPQWCGSSAGDLALSPVDGLLRTALYCGCASGATSMQIIDPASANAVSNGACLVDAGGTPYTEVYGLAFDSSGLWGSEGGPTPRLLRIDPDTGLVNAVPISGGYSCGYGLACLPCVAPDPCRVGLDSDGDTLIDTCDNCPVDPNPLQEDADLDSLGDACDCLPDNPLNPPLEAIDRIDLRKLVGPDIEISWPLVTDAIDVHVLRGYLTRDRRFADSLSTLQCFTSVAVPATRAIDSAARESSLYFYLATTSCLGQETSLGQDSFGVERWPPPFARPACPEAWRDSDGDGVQDCEDVCPSVNDPLQGDGDADGRGDACDSCPLRHDPFARDADGDRAGDACDCDRDGDGFENAGVDGAGVTCAPAPRDNCPDIANPSQANADGDACGDACDAAPVLAGAGC